MHLADFIQERFYLLQVKDQSPLQKETQKTFSCLPQCLVTYLHRRDVPCFKMCVKNTWHQDGDGRRAGKEIPILS